MWFVIFFYVSFVIFLGAERGRRIYKPSILAHQQLMELDRPVGTSVRGRPHVDQQKGKFRARWYWGAQATPQYTHIKKGFKTREEADWACVQFEIQQVCLASMPADVYTHSVRTCVCSSARHRAQAAAGCFHPLPLCNTPMRPVRCCLQLKPLSSGTAAEGLFRLRVCWAEICLGPRLPNRHS